jgi:hypothetical protein
VSYRKIGPCERIRPNHRWFRPCGLIASTWGWPYCKNSMGNKDPMVGWNVLRLQLIGV